MSTDRTVRRYSAYFRGWAQAFGEHERIEDPERGLRWLVGNEQIGLILVPAFKRLWFPRLLGHPDQAPPDAILRPDGLEIAAARFALGGGGAALLPHIAALLAREGALHLFQTYHLIYPAGTRILTVSPRAPLGILYRELAPLRLIVDGGPGQPTADQPGPAAAAREPGA